MGTPGDGHEPDESFEETARREIREEEGVYCSLTGVFWASHSVFVHERGSDASFQLSTVEFEADYEGGNIDIGHEEIIDAQWFAEPHAAVHGFLTVKVGARADDE